MGLLSVCFALRYNLRLIGGNATNLLILDENFGCKVLE